MVKNECEQTVSGFLYGEMIVSNVFLGRQKEPMKEAFQAIMKNIKELEANQPPKIVAEKLIFDVTQNLKIICLELPIDKFVEKFVRAWATLVINWSNNTVKNQSLVQDATFLIRLIEQNLTIKEGIDIMQMLNKKLRDYRNWLPPAFEVAKHYLDYLDNDKP